MARSPVQLELPGITGEYIPPMSDDDLREFISALVSGTVFTSAHVHDQSCVPSVFMALLFGGPTKWSKSGLNRIGAIYEYLDAAGPRSINGYPIFYSFRLICKEDWEDAIRIAKKEEERRKNIEL